MFKLEQKSMSSQSQREQNLVFNQLTYYVHNMVLFGINEKEVRVLAQKFIKLYNLDESKTRQIYVRCDVRLE